MSDIKPVPLAAIIDDDSCYEFTLKKMLSIFNIATSVISFPDGKQAIDYLNMVGAYPAQIPDLIFLDINMPKMDGWGFLEHYCKIKPQLQKITSIYMLSSSISNEDAQQAKAHAEVSDYLIKPATKEDLQRVLQEVQRTITKTAG